MLTSKDLMIGDWYAFRGHPYKCTASDIAFICQTCTEVINSLPDKPCAYTPGFKDLYGEVLKRFNEQRKK